MAFSLITHVEAGGTANGVTSGSADTTGANLIVISVAWYALSADPTISDSKSNTWTPLTNYDAPSGFFSNQLWYCYGGTVGSGHTFSANATGIYPSIQVLAFGGSAASPFDQQNGASSNSASSLQPGSITPTENDELVVSGLMHDNNSAGAVSINGGFTAYTSAYNAGNSEGGGIAYLIQTTAAAANPTWDITTATTIVSSIASFKAAAGGAGNRRRRVLFCGRAA